MLLSMQAVPLDFMVVLILECLLFSLIYLHTRIHSDTASP